MRSKLYFITQDIDKVLEDWYGSSLELPSEAFYVQLRSSFERCLHTYSFSGPFRDSGDEDIKVRFQYVPRDRFQHLQKRPDAAGEFWIGLDNVYVNGSDVDLKVTRLYDQSRQLLGVGLRPEAVPIYGDLLTQLGECARKYNSQIPEGPEVILADDGSFTGGTMIQMLKLIESPPYNVTVTQIRLGFCTLKGLREIHEHLLSTGRTTHLQFGLAIVLDREMSCIDWVNERDFFLGVLRSGHTLGYRKGKFCEPCQPALCEPYLFRWGEMERSTSIRGGQYPVSACCTDFSIRLWTEIERLNRDRLGRSLQIGDLPRYPGPGYIYDKVAPLLPYLVKWEKEWFEGMGRAALRANNDWSTVTEVR